MQNNFRVVWNEDLKLWQVKDTEDDLALKNFYKKRDAVEYGTHTAQNHKPSRLIIKNKDGLVDMKYIYEEKQSNSGNS